MNLKFAGVFFWYVQPSRKKIVQDKSLSYKKKKLECLPWDLNGGIKNTLAYPANATVVTKKFQSIGYF